MCIEYNIAHSIIYVNYYIVISDVYVPITIMNHPDRHKTKKIIDKQLSIQNFSKCNPARHRTRKNTRCLPKNVYDLANTYKIAHHLDDHEFIDKLLISDTKKKYLRKYYLRPRFPTTWKKNPTTWLDNFNIEDVMTQYTEAFSWFLFKGVLPIDFSAPSPYIKDRNICLHPEICDLDLAVEYKKGIRAIGFIFNLDPHFKGGSHWVALYIDIHNINHPWCGYFDSYGYRPPALISRFMRSFRTNHPDIELMYNSRRFQYGNSECGMYSLYFILSMIHEVKFKTFCKKSISDAYMLELRHVLFSK